MFVDESFYAFFGFNNPDGNFCHGAIGVPIDNYETLCQSLEPIINAYNRLVQKLTGRVPNEVKSRILRRLPLRFQVEFVRELTMRLEEQGGFVSGFYTPTRGFVMESVRTRLLDTAEEVPQDHQVLYEAAKQELTSNFQGNGQADLITNLILMPVASIKFLLGSFDCSYRIHYDPRQGDEDHAVRTAIGTCMNGVRNVPNVDWQFDNYRGMDTTRRSEEEIGLQLADVVAGDVRHFFRNDPDALIEGSTNRLITPDSDEPLQKFDELGGHLFKAASLRPMSTRLHRRLTRPNRANLISYYYPVLGSGMLSCTTFNGQARSLEMPTRSLYDLLD